MSVGARLDALATWSGRRVLSRAAAAPVVLALVLLGVAALAPSVLAPGDPLVGVLDERLSPPSPAHILGTDELGRDLYTRLVHGTATSVTSAAIAVLIGVALGCALGLAGALGGHRVDGVVMRLVDALLAVPTLLLSLGLIAVLGPGPVNAAIAVGVASAGMFARVTRADTFRVLQRGYVTQAIVAGRSRSAVVAAHVLPNVLAPVAAVAVLQFAEAILAIAALSFLGYGSRPPAPEWGALVASGRDYLTSAPWLIVFPGLVIAAASLAVHAAARLLRRSAA